jgi:hypothetical protein
VEAADAPAVAGRRWAGALGGCGCAALAILGLLGTGTGLGALIGGWLLSSRWEEATQEALTRWTGGEISIGDIGLRWNGVVVSDVVLLGEDGQVCARVDTVRVLLDDLWLLTEPDITLTELRLENVTLSMHQLPSGGLALPRQTLALLQSPPADMPAVRSPKVELVSVQGRIELPPPALPVPASPGVPPGEVPSPDLSVKIERIALGQAELAGALRWAELDLEKIELVSSGGSQVHVARAQLRPPPAGHAGAVGWAALSELQLDTPGGQARLQQVTVDTPALGAVSSFGVVTLAGIRVEADTEKAEIESIRVDPGGPWVGGTLPLGSVTLQGCNLLVPRRWRALLGMAEHLAADAGVPWPELDIDTVTLAGGVPLGRATIQDLRAEGMLVTRAGMRWRRGSTGALVAGPGLGIERVYVGPGDWSFVGAPRVSWAEVVGVRGAIDPYGPWLGLEGDIVALLPSGTAVAQATARDVDASVSVGTRSGTLRAGQVVATDTVLQPTAWTARATAAQTVKLILRSTSGELTFDAGQVELGPTTLADRPVVPRISASVIDVRSGEDVVAGADRVTFEGTSLTVEGGDWWTVLVAPHAIMVPSVIREYVPVTLGGALGTHRPWWGIDLGGLPLELHRASGQVALHVEDRVLSKKSWDIALESWSVGPPGDVAPLTASGKLGRGTWSATGVAQPDGKLSLSIEAKDLEGKDLEPFVARSLTEAGLKASWSWPWTWGSTSSG